MCDLNFHIVFRCVSSVCAKYGLVWTSEAFLVEDKSERLLDSLWTCSSVSSSCLLKNIPALSLSLDHGDARTALVSRVADKKDKEQMVVFVLPPLFSLLASFTFPLSVSLPLFFFVPQQHCRHLNRH